MGVFCKVLTVSASCRHFGNIVIIIIIISSE